jgi:hypothetical protein
MGSEITPRPIHTAPMAVGPDEQPEPVFLYCPEEGGWRTGVWFRSGYSDGEWCRQGWHSATDYSVELRPTQWLPCPSHQRVHTGRDCHLEAMLSAYGACR